MQKLIKWTLSAAVCLSLLPTQALAARQVIPVGKVVGLQLQNDCVSVAAFDEELGSCAKAAGLQIGDEITCIDGIAVDDAEDVRTALQQSHGRIQMTILRNAKEHKVCLTPEITAQGPRLGIYLRQGITGIGTVTWYDPATGNFGALGHGVNDTKGELAQMSAGHAYSAGVMSVKKGKQGQPGQLRGGIADTTPLGSLQKNTHQGVFGKTEIGWEGQAVEVATAKEITAGPATIYSTVSGEGVQSYSVEILKIYPNSQKEGRNMLLRVTDPTLLQTTGGIVQGMSGSPIIQDGKLVGAVTHVLVNDPTTGYGIFIENMLDAAA